MTQSFTDADVELVAGRLWEQDERFWSAVHRVPWTDADTDEQVQYRAKAVEILSALAAAGRRVPVDAEPGLADIVERCPKCNAALYRCESAGCSALALCGEAWCAAHAPDGPWLPVPTEEDTDGPAA